MGSATSKDSSSEPLLTPPVNILPNYGSSIVYRPINNSYLDLDIVSAEAFRTGHSANGRMSVVRRFFCLLTTFDFVFTILLWLICVLARGVTVSEAFQKEVVHYAIKSSLFDIPAVAAWRFILLLLAYGIFGWSHWFVVAITTATSGALIIAKIFFYDWAKYNGTSPVILFISSFIISWGEAWFLDFKVVPTETKASIIHAQHINDRVPQIPTLYEARRANYPMSEDGTFYSPAESDNESGGEEGDFGHCEPTPAVEVEPVLSPVEAEYKKKAELALDSALNILCAQGWKTEKSVGKDVVQSLHVPKYGKVFKFVGVCNVPPETMFQEMVENFENVTQWNPQVSKLKILQTIDSHSDVVYVSSEGLGGGLVSGRDFVDARIWQKRGQTYIYAMIGVKHPSMPNQPKYIRGENGPCIYVFSPVDDEPNKCHVQWLLNTNLKGWIPQYVIDQTLADNLLAYISAFRTYSETLARTEGEV